jgi:3-methylfumaryl-CoA hydratase
MRASSRRAGVICRHSTEALAGLLGVTGRWSEGSELPPMWHLAHLLDASPQADIGIDGHPSQRVPSPLGPGSRRMFAGGRTWHLAPLRIGEPAVRTTTVTGTAVKHGRHGDLTFVTVRHQILQAGSVAIIEEQDIIYRAAESAGSLPLPGTAGRPIDPDTPLGGMEFDIDPTVLFRFSALTYNAHRIQFDHGYAAYEGYSDLVVHGPLHVILMAERLRLLGHSLVGLGFSYRLTAPAIGPQRLTVRGAGTRAEVRAGNGTVVARGELGEHKVSV